MMRLYKILSGIRLGVGGVSRYVASALGSSSQNANSKSQKGLRGNAGFTLIEIAFACEVMMLLTLIGFNESRRVQEHARVAACLSYHVALQRTLWGDYAITGDFPNNIDPILVKMPSSSIEADFSYVGGPGSPLAGDYYLRCNHDHSYVAVLFVDSGSFLPPKPIYNLGLARGVVP